MFCVSYSRLLYVRGLPELGCFMYVVWPGLLYVHGLVPLAGLVCVCGLAPLAWPVYVHGLAPLGCYMYVVCPGCYMYVVWLHWAGTGTWSAPIHKERGKQVLRDKC